MPLLSLPSELLLSIYRHLIVPYPSESNDLHPPILSILPLSSTSRLLRSTYIHNKSTLLPLALSAQFPSKTLKWRLALLAMNRASFPGSQYTPVSENEAYEMLLPVFDLDFGSVLQKGFYKALLKLEMETFKYIRAEREIKYLYWAIARHTKPSWSYDRLPPPALATLLDANLPPKFPYHDALLDVYINTPDDGFWWEYALRFTIHRVADSEALDWVVDFGKQYLLAAYKFTPGMWIGCCLWEMAEVGEEGEGIEGALLRGLREGVERYRLNLLRERASLENGE